MFFPKRSKIQKSQRGFTLVAVLILSGLASILVLSSIKDNVNQERLSGNFQKKINARLMSERGIFDTMAEAKSYLDDNPSADVDELAANIASLPSDGTGLKGAKYTVKTTPDGDELVLESTGNRFEGQSTLKVRLKIVPASGGSAPFSSAIVGCDSVNLTGSGQIDSYNSGEAPYDESSPGTEGNVTTINKGENNNGADVTLGGDSPVYGDISATGKINTNSSKVVGNLHANGNITLGENSNPVSGYVLTRGNYFQDGGDVGGYVRANGDAEMDSSTNILNNKNQGLDIQYGGEGRFKDTSNKKYEAAMYNVYPNVPKVKDSGDSKDTSDPATNCDYLDIASVVTAISPNTSSLPDFTSRGSGGDTYTYDVTGFSGIKTTTWVEGQPVDENFDFSPEMATVFGNSLSVVKLSSFHLKGDNILNISGDTTLFVDGNFTMDGATKMTIAADSSLTLIVTGTVNLLAGAEIIANQQGLTASGLPAMSIYSSYNSDNENKAGIKINGAFETYAQIYAPLADVKINGSGTLFGAVRGKTVAVKGGAKIHYDAALGATNQGDNGSSQQARLQFAGFEY